jgi:two-component system, cell cycle sensor histidine kinase and response regulator CckA
MSADMTASSNDDREKEISALPRHGLAALDGTETILVVEDDAAVRNLVSRVLRARGYDVLEACNGEDALVIMGSHAAPVHLVVSDVLMPRMDGRQLFANMRRWYPSLRFLFISGHTNGDVLSDEDFGSRCRLLEKPFTGDQLCREVRSLLDDTGPVPPERRDVR